jgi:hypothetical protein
MSCLGAKSFPMGRRIFWDFMQVGSDCRTGVTMLLASIKPCPSSQDPVAHLETIRYIRGAYTDVVRVSEAIAMKTFPSREDVIRH